MKGDRQLNKALEVPAQGTTARRFPPNVFERLVGVEEVPGIKKGQATSELATRLEIQGTKAWQSPPSLTVFSIVNDLDYT